MTSGQQLESWLELVSVGYFQEGVGWTRLVGLVPLEAV